MPIWGWVVIAVVVILIIAMIAIYNSLVRLRMRVDEAWSDITVQLKRRSDLIPNLVNAVKGYAAHESKVFEAVTKAPEITDTEDKIQASRRFYNGGVRDLNTKIQTFPSNIFAGMFGFKEREFFEVENREEVEKAPEVKF